MLVRERERVADCMRAALIDGWVWARQLTATKLTAALSPRQLDDHLAHELLEMPELEPIRRAKCEWHTVAKSESVSDGLILSRARWRCCSGGGAGQDRREAQPARSRSGRGRDGRCARLDSGQCGCGSTEGLCCGVPLCELLTVAHSLFCQTKSSLSAR